MDKRDSGGNVTGCRKNRVGGVVQVSGLLSIRLAIHPHPATPRRQPHNIPHAHQPHQGTHHRPRQPESHTRAQKGKRVLTVGTHRQEETPHCQPSRARGLTITEPSLPPDPHPPRITHPNRSGVVSSSRLPYRNPRRDGKPLLPLVK
jgi:hypothetical protein